MKQLLLYVLVTLFSIHGVAQTDSIQLKEVEVTDFRQRSSESTVNNIKIDSSFRQRHNSQTIGDVISLSGAAFVKDNGTGRLATLSIRGTSASQNAVIWNGLTINTPTLALYDLTMTPAFFTDEISMQYGGNGPLNGSQAMGGVLRMNSLPVFNQGSQTALYISAGSYDDYAEGIKVSYGNKKYFTKTSYYNRTALNNYSYHDPYIPGSPEKKMKHAAFFMRGLQNEHAFVSGKHFASIHLMQVNAYRELPRQMGSYDEESGEMQKDDQLKAAVRWKYTLNRIRTELNAGYMKDLIRYSDTKTGIINSSRGESYQASLDLIYESGFHTLLAGAFSTICKGNIQGQTGGLMQGYIGVQSDERSALYINYKMNPARNVTINAAIRNEWVRNTTVLLPSAGIMYTPLTMLNIYANAGKIYRSPSLNDLYWFPGGNITLQPEVGFQYDAGIKTKVNGDIIALDASAAVFLINIDNYIQWLPDHSNMYSPSNLLKVNSRGIESSAIAVLKNRNWTYSLQTGLHFTYIYSKNNEGYGSERQLIYVPRTQWQIAPSAGYKNTTATFTINYTGHRYITEDNASFLEPFNTVSLLLSNKFLSGKYIADITASCINIFNAQYEVIALHPMPGRIFRVGITITKKEL